MRADDLIAVFVLFTGVAIVVTGVAKPGELQRQQASDSIAFRSFHYATLFVVASWSALSLGLEIAGKTVDRSSMPWLMGLFMMSWWPFIGGVWSSKATPLR